VISKAACHQVKANHHSRTNKVGHSKYDTW